MTETALDAAHREMMLDEDDASARLQFYERLAEVELFVLLEGESDGDTLDPDLLEIDGSRYVAVFDREERLTEFTARVAPFAAMSGRLVAAMLTGQGVGIVLNPGVAPSFYLIPPAAVEWLAEMVAASPEETSQDQVRPRTVAPPRGVPEALLKSLDAKLARAAGLAGSACLAQVTYSDGRRVDMLALIDAQPGAEGALARAVNEALIFSGLESGALDVAFFASSDPIAASLARVGLRFDLPEAEKPAPAPTAPGRDPDAPPILR